MGKLFASGRVVDCILLFMAIESFVLIAVHRFTRAGPSPRELIVSLSAGVALLLALRAAVVGSHWPMVAIWLVVALIAHLGDLGLRWSRLPPGSRDETESSVRYYSSTEGPYQ
jgi:hypothetical protein